MHTHAYTHTHTQLFNNFYPKKPIQSVWTQQLLVLLTFFSNLLILPAETLIIGQSRGQTKLSLQCWVSPNFWKTFSKYLVSWWTVKSLSLVQYLHGNIVCLMQGNSNKISQTFNQAVTNTDTKFPTSSKYIHCFWIIQKKSLANHSFQ